jgi:hypothetical protein
MAQPNLNTPEDVVRRNIALTGELMRYLLEQPDLLAALPDNFELVILPEDDPEMRWHNLQLLDAYGSEGRPVVFARLKASRANRLSRAGLNLYAPVAEAVAA